MCMFARPLHSSQPRLLVRAHSKSMVLERDREKERAVAISCIIALMPILSQLALRMQALEFEAKVVL